MLQVSNDYLQKPSLITVQGIGFSLAQLDKDEAFGKRLTKVRGLLQLEKDQDLGESRRTARRKQRIAPFSNNELQTNNQQICIFISSQTWYK